MTFATVGQAFLCIKTTKFTGIFIRVLEATVFASGLFRPVSSSGLGVPVRFGLRICAQLCAFFTGQIRSELFQDLPVIFDLRNFTPLIHITVTRFFIIAPVFQETVHNFEDLMSQCYDGSFFCPYVLPVFCILMRKRFFSSNAAVYYDTIITVKPLTSFSLALIASGGFGTWKWNNGATTSSITVNNISSERTYSVTHTTQGGKVSTTNFHIKLSIISPSS
jgi:hypothetical protein